MAQAGGPDGTKAADALSDPLRENLRLAGMDADLAPEPDVAFNQPFATGTLSPVPSVP